MNEGSGGKGEYRCFQMPHIWLERRNLVQRTKRQEEKIFKKIFKSQKDKHADLWNVQMHVYTQSSVKQSLVVLLGILILFYISVFHTSFKTPLILSFIHFLLWYILFFHPIFIFPLGRMLLYSFCPQPGDHFGPHTEEELKLPTKTQLFVINLPSPQYTGD